MILRETQNQNDADDANDAESGIWYKDIPKTASQASSASLSSRKDAAGGLGYTPEMCMWMTTCYASKTHLPNLKMFAIKPYIHTYSYIPQSESTVIHPKILTRKSESVLIQLPGHLSEHPLAAQGGKQVPVLPAFEKFPFVVSRKIFLYQHPAEEF